MHSLLQKNKKSMKISHPFQIVFCKKSGLPKIRQSGSFCRPVNLIIPVYAAGNSTCRPDAQNSLLQRIGYADTRLDVDLSGYDRRAALAG